ncbi:MAG: prepilin-type N-terminal cleavage/methylation domain-containing protein [Kiritimatiellae bacterium]|nr:prepilin-type N-terminal cleavage/methylation domain-containing protein [Kiritimatiellia bacterium]
MKNSKGFTLVEMLVVIAIISVLAAALFPAISNALSSASATALKQKGRGIWVAITSSNMEREPLNLGSLWPYEWSKDAGAGSPGTAVAYFNYLLSDGSTTTKTTDDTDLRVVADLTPDTLIANGVPAAKIGDTLTEDNIAWGVVVVGDSTPTEIPFLISRNFPGNEPLKQQTKPSEVPLTLDATIKPFNATRAVWVSRGGGTFDARKKYFTITQLMGLGECKAPDDTDTFTYWAK